MVEEKPNQEIQLEAGNNLINGVISQKIGLLNRLLRVPMFMGSVTLLILKLKASFTCLLYVQRYTSLVSFSC
jgi:hypothetical protein